MEHHELIHRMKEKAGLVQAVVSTAGGMEDVLRYAVDVTLRQNGKTIAAPGLDPESRQKLEAFCGACGTDGSASTAKRPSKSRSIRR